MLQAFSWKGYWALMGLSLLLYYSWLFYRYRHSFSLYKKVSAPGKDGQAFSEEKVKSADPETGRQLEKLRGDISTLFTKAGKEKTARGELLYSLKGLLKLEEYKAVAGSEFREDITKQILMQAQEHCSFELEARELNGLWAK